MEKKFDTLLERMDQILALLQDVVHSAPLPLVKE